MSKLDPTSFLGRELSNMLILQTLHSQGSQSGYSLLHLLKELSTNMINPKAGTLYPQIEKLHTKGYIDKKVENTSATTGKVREVAIYTINPKGFEFLRELSQEWLILAEFINQFIRGKLVE
ncbi:MAG: PadR family transcriptional regulator [Candidatus Heimdallarchaeota archaeon]|nr:PadR family transcriptional regulator [Candidatus Heimdallarchaeota archaeon]